MVLVAGQIGLISDPLLVSAWLPGRTDGLQQPEPNHSFEIDTVPITFPTSAQGAVQGGGAPGAPGPAGALVAAQVGSERDLNTGQDWFEKVHVFPDDATDNPQRDEGFKIEFGNILAQVDEVYEVYSAFRHDPVTLTAITNNVTPGVETPDVTPPVLVTAQTSILDPTSTFNTDGVTGLGTLVKTKVRALLDGLPEFDDSIDFLFSPGNTVLLLASGSRIALLTAEFDGPVRETMTFLTDVIPARDGGEQRLSLRKQDREGWSVPFKLTGTDRQRMQAVLFDWQHNNFGLPLWHERIKLSAAVSGGSVLYPVTGADDVDLRVGGLAVAFKDAFTFDVLTIVSVTDTLVTAESASLNAYAAGDLIIPVRTARITSAPRGRRHSVNLEEFQIEFESTDNDTGRAAASTAWNPNTYNGRILLDECNVITGTMAEQFDRKVVVIDNATGMVSQTSPWDRHKRVSRKGFAAHDRAEVQDLKAMLRSIRGRQKAWYLPTFIEDLDVKADLGSGAATMDITNIGYVRFIKDRKPKMIFRITFTDATSLVREVQSSAVIDSTTERLTLDTTWPSARTVAEIERVQFYELVRFDTDRFTITYPQVGQAFMVAPVRVVFDDD